MNYVPLVEERLKSIDRTTSFIYNYYDLYETDDTFYFIDSSDYIQDVDSEYENAFVNLVYIILLDLGCEKKLKYADKISGLIIGESYPLEEVDFNFMNTGKSFHIYDVIIDNYYKLLILTNYMGYPNVCRMILDMFGEELDIDVLKRILRRTNEYVSNLECKAVLIDYISKHDKKEDIEL